MRFSDSYQILSHGLSETRFVGRSAAARQIEEDVDCAARSEAKVLVTGETGVGKEVVGKLIHQRSGRANRPLVTLNCAGLPDSLLESELFGHVRGSFTGAYRDKPGLLETGSGGTVFLDEVGEMSARMQVVLLRFLETGEIQPVGSERTKGPVDVRLITATNRILPTQVAAGAFREDLYYRLNVIQLVIPPLRERKDDIPLLVDFFLEKYSTQHRIAQPQLSPAAMEMLIEHRWPGNVRELKNVLERLLLKASGRVVEPHDLGAEIFHSEGLGRLPEASYDEKSPLDVASQLVAQMLGHRQSFWSVVYPMFKGHDLTREDLRKVVQMGLQRSQGSYKRLSELFNIPEKDYKRFLSFLRKHDCHISVQGLRAVSTSPSGRAPDPTSGEGAA